MDIIKSVLQHISGNKDVYASYNCKFFNYFIGNPLIINEISESNYANYQIIFMQKELFELNKMTLPIYIIGNDIYYYDEKLRIDDYSQIQASAYFDSFGAASAYQELIDEMKCARAIYKFFNPTLSEQDIDDAIKEINKEQFKIELNNLIERTVLYDINDTIKKISDTQSKMEDFKRKYYDSCKALDNLIKISANSDMNKSSIYDNIMKILNHKKVISVNINNNQLIIKTTPIVLTEPKMNIQFQLGEFDIYFPLTPRGTIYMNGDKLYTNYFGKGPHPHISAEGRPCWGTADAQIAQMVNLHEYYAAFLTLLSYLETCNIDDCAGAKIYNYPVIGMHVNDMLEAYGRNIRDNDDTYEDDEDYNEEDEMGEENNFTTNGTIDF